MSDAPAAAPGKAPRLLVALALLVASSGCCWSFTPPFLRLAARESLLGPQVHAGTVARVRYVHAVTFERLLGRGERPGPGEQPARRQRNLGSDWIRHVEAVTTDGSVPAWPDLEPRPGEARTGRHGAYAVEIDCPDLGPAPIEWDASWGGGDPTAFRPGAKVLVRETTKGLRITPAP